MAGKPDFIANGSFETQAGGDAVAWIGQSPRFEGGAAGQLQFRQTSAPDRWTLSQGQFFVETYAPPRTAASWDGKVWAFTDGAWFSQDVAGLTAGLVYDLAFIAYDSAGSPGPSVLQVFWNGVQVFDSAELDGDDGAVSHLLLTARDGPNRVEFRTFGIVVIDDVRLFAAGTTETADFSASTGRVAANLSDVVIPLPSGTNLPALHAYEGSAAFALNGVRAFVGGSAEDVAFGGALGGVLEGRGGADTLVGGAGRNQLRGGEGNDQLFGGDDFDDTHGNVGDDLVHGGGDNDWVVGGQGADTLFGDDGDDLCYGQLGEDTVDGGAGHDAVVGGQANDRLLGGAGNDFLTGDRGNDTVTGGAGADIFHTNAVQGVDLITDFSLAEGDRVQIDPGNAYVLRQAGADTVIDFGVGNVAVLVGVQLSTLTGEWIFGG